MFEALSIGATGMQTQQLNVDTIANNLANANTAGFKKGRVGFVELMVQQGAGTVQPSAEDLRSGILGSVQRLGAGVGVTGLGKVFDAGDIKKTDSPYDIAIQGDGFLEVTLPDGSSGYIRGGTLKVNQEGLLATQSGFPLKPAIAIPDNAKSAVVAADGRVLVTVPNQSQPIEAGRFELVRFANPSGLLAQSGNLYLASDASGEPTTSRPGEEGSGTVVQGFLEASNVKMVDEMVNLMLAQRAYEASVKVVQAADEMLGLVNNLRK
ncbi:MAG: flgG [Ramlibacter sp.]|nr:flgG [Ramlibacter sp.]